MTWNCRIRYDIFRYKKSRSIQRTQTPPRLWPLTLSCVHDLNSTLKKRMSLDVVYCIVSWYDICECNSLRDMTISLFLWTLTLACDLHRPSRSPSFLLLDGRYIFVYWVPSTKFVGLIEFEIWTIVLCTLQWRHNDIITHSIFTEF